MNNGWNINPWQHFTTPCPGAAEGTSAFTGCKGPITNKPLTLRGHVKDLRRGRRLKILIYSIKSLDPLHLQPPFCSLCHETSSLGILLTMGTWLTILGRSSASTLLRLLDQHSQVPFLIPFRNVTTAITWDVSFQRSLHLSAKLTLSGRFPFNLSSLHTYIFILPIATQIHSHREINNGTRLFFVY